MHRRVLSLEQTHLYLEIVEASLMISRREQFFPFVQGCFQYLFPHDILICGYEVAPGQYRFESYTSLPYFDAGQLAMVTSGEHGIVWRAMKAWQEVLRPIIVLPGTEAGDFGGYCIPFAGAHEDLNQSELHGFIAHGMCGQDGRIDSFFCFSRLPRDPDAEHACLMQWLMPYLHAAFVRSRHGAVRSKAKPRLSAQPPAITDRELEILHWVNLGKTNWEIAKILEISPLTVKNHVQNIFRKLNVQTRLHAAMKASEIGLLEQGSQNLAES
jgi:transcriptional regulator EpsA